MKDLPLIEVLLAGNPNSGKTSLFNELVGANRKVGNFAGVTVEKVEGSLIYKNHQIRFTDLPGTYSISAYSPEEMVARNYITSHHSDLIIHVLDSNNIERNLLFTTQLMELGAPFIIAFNIYDEMVRKGIKADIKQLEKLLGTAIIPTSSRLKTGINELLDKIIELHNNKITVQKKFNHPEYIEERLIKLAGVIEADKEIADNYSPYWLAIKLLENDEQVYSLLKERAIWIKTFPLLTEISKEIKNYYKEEADLILNENRVAFAKGAFTETVDLGNTKKRNLTDILDFLLINRITGIPVFILFMWATFQLVFQIGEYPVNWLQEAFNYLAVSTSSAIENEIIRSVVTDGIISGVGGVLAFLPNILLLFLALAIFEGTGYMARAAFVIDKVMHTFGLHGKSAISLITGLGCSIPAFMSTRTLKSQRDRLTTMFIIPFMSCGAKLPVYILIIGAFFPVKYAGTILFAVYMTGILLAMLSAKLLKTTILKGESEPFVMELPPYRLPSPKSLLYQMWNKAAMYLKKAATMILLASVLVWLASNFPKSNRIEKFYHYEMQEVANNDYLNDAEKTNIINALYAKEQSLQFQYSVIGRIGKFIEPVIKPLGFDWRIGISLLTGFAAKELVVSSMATIYSVGDVEGGHTLSLQEKLKNNYSTATAFALLMFVLIYVPCVAATAIFHKEAGKLKYTAFYFGFTMTLAWLLSFLVYQVL